MARTERSEKELGRDINAAIAGTEDEIFTDAMGDDELDNDGDTDLEEMGEGLEGDHLDEEDAEEGEAGDDEDAEDEDPEEDDEASADDEEDEVRAAEEQQPRDQRDRFDRREPRIPPERLRHEAEARRQAEEREREIAHRYATLEARFNDMQARINAGPAQRTEQPDPPAKPDMFVEPEKYEQWIIERANEQALQNVQRMFAHRDEQQRVAFNQNVDRSLQAAKVSERGFEFDAAYSALLRLNPQNPQDRAAVQNIVHSPDPGRSLFDWWDRNGGEEYRETLIARLTGRDPRQDRGRDERRPARRSRDDRYEQPRHEIRPARPLRSLNAASGGSSHRVSDPEMLDGSDSSVFDFATRK